MSAFGIYDLPVVQGTTYSTVVVLEIAGVETNFTGYTAQLRVGDLDGAVLTLGIGSGITVNGGGDLAIVMTDEQTALLTDGLSYELDVTSPLGAVTPVLRGRIRLDERSVA